MTSDTVNFDGAASAPTRDESLRRLGVAPPKAPELRAGDVLEGRYALLAPLGEGGMGDVWLAHNALLDIRVALKVLRVDDSHPERRTKLTQRLLHEARAAAMLGHPAIVRITDFGITPSGNGFFVMELLEGEDLFTFLDRHGRLSAVKAVRTLLPIAHALVAAHAKSIVHRDLKPENIFLARTEDRSALQPKLIDFGVAKLQKVANERITMAGAVLGSPGYMAPEQARGEDVDERADVWGLSVVLYETIAGRLPFEGKNYNALMRSIIEDKPAPITSFGVGDDQLSAIVERGLAKDPDNRWQSMRELGVGLAKWLLERGVSEDITGGQLSGLWLRDRTSPDLAGSSAPPPLRSSGVPGSSNLLIPEAETRHRRAQAETLLIEADPPSAPARDTRWRGAAWAALGVPLLAITVAIFWKAFPAAAPPASAAGGAPAPVTVAAAPRATEIALSPATETASAPAATTASAHASSRTVDTHPVVAPRPASKTKPAAPKLKNPF